MAARSTSGTYAPGRSAIPYADAKHAAEVEALRVAARGLDVVVACPAHVLGAGDDRRSSTDVVRRFLLRRIPAYVDGAICIVDVADVAAGLLLCDERGAAGERYILGTRNYTWQRLFGELQQLSGIEAPAVRLPVPAALALAEASVRAPGPTLITPSEVRDRGHWWTYRSAKARRELGWSDAAARGDCRGHGPLLRSETRRPPARTGRRQPLGWRLVGGALRAVIR